MNKYQLHGYDSFQQGLIIADCPYKTEVPYKDWCHGWRMAKEGYQRVI